MGSAAWGLPETGWRTIKCITAPEVAFMEQDLMGEDHKKAVKRGTASSVGDKTCNCG